MKADIKSIVKENIKSFKLARLLKWQFYYQQQLPATIELELDSLCNRKCDYCPVSLRPRPRQQMSFELFQKIISDLHGMHWQGYLLPHFYNEPLLDKRLREFLSYAKNILGNKVKVWISTNGDFLNIDLFSEWVQELQIVDIFSISIHDKHPRQELIDLLNYAQKKSLEKHLRFNDVQSDNTRKHNRGGLVQIHGEKVQSYLLKNGCNWALKMVITSSGNYLICCNDYDEQNINGNVNNSSIKNLWSQTEQLRKNLYLANYEKDICKVCVGIEK